MKLITLMKLMTKPPSREHRKRHCVGFAGGLPDKEKRMPLLGSWTSFQKETTIENMKKSKINYLLTSPKSQQYPVCETYLDLLVDTMEVL